MKIRSTTVVVSIFLATALAWAASPATADAPAGDNDHAQSAQEQALIQQFLIVHDMATEPPDELTEKIEQILADLADHDGKDRDPEFLLVNNPDIDAGCLAGRSLFLSRGLAARLTTKDELSAALALAHSACQTTGELWENRAETGLPDLDTASPLMIRYQDFRIEPNQALYNQLVARGCGENTDCMEQAAGTLEDLDVAPDALRHLLYRIGQEMPGAALFERFGAPPEHGEKVEADEQFIQALGRIYRERESMDYLLQSQHYIFDDELRPAYRAFIRSRRSENTNWILMLHYTRLNLINLHPEYGHRDLARAQAGYPDYPHHAFYSGWAYWQQRRPSNAVPLFEESLKVLPQASTHFYLGLAMNNRRQPDQARAHFRIAAQAGEISRYATRAAEWLEALEEPDEKDADASPEPGNGD